MAKKENNKLEKTLQDRGSEYGDFSDHSQLTQDLIKAFQHFCVWDDLTAIQKESLHMIFHKIGRIGCGNPNNKDSWHDIAGYATLVEERL